jgi:hypothetical protein
LALGLVTLWSGEAMGQACGSSGPLCNGACPPGLQCTMQLTACVCQPVTTAAPNTAVPVTSTQGLAVALAALFAVGAFSLACSRRLGRR